MSDVEQTSAPENGFIAALSRLTGDAQAYRMTQTGEVLLCCSVEDLHSLLKSLRDDDELAFTQLTDITAVDYPEREMRFEMVYQMLSVKCNQRLRVLVSINEQDIVPSVTDLFLSANWAEREIWDMFGIFFSDHPDLRRLLTDYGFEGHPLRKDFPLTGYVEVRYSEAERRVVYEPVSLVQEFRDFDFLSPWEGVQAHLTNDDNSAEEGA